MLEFPRVEKWKQRGTRSKLVGMNVMCPYAEIVFQKEKQEYLKELSAEAEALPPKDLRLVKCQKLRRAC